MRARSRQVVREPPIRVEDDHARRYPGADKLATEVVINLVRTESLVAAEVNGRFRRFGLTGSTFNVLMILNDAAHPAPRRPQDAADRAHRYRPHGAAQDLADALPGPDRDDGGPLRLGEGDAGAPARQAAVAPRGQGAGFREAGMTRPPIAEALDLEPHPEGGWYRETYRSSVRVEPPGLGAERQAPRGSGQPRWPAPGRPRSTKA